MDAKYYKKYEPIFGTWKIVKEIGSGGFGRVFELEKEEFGETYRTALKAITVPADDDDLRNTMNSERLTMEEAAGYFQGIVEDMAHEFSIMAKLKGNSNIVSYEDHQVIPHEKGIGWDILIRMELLTPLLDHIRDNGIDEDEVIRLGIDMCRALELCDKRNIIHRDIKPENIFVSDLGNFKLGILE